MTPTTDITSRQDIQRLVDEFYTRIRADAVLGPIFDDVAHVDWALHLPKMYDFWESVLFGRPVFKGNPLAVHRALATLTPLTSSRFARWVSLFQQTVDELFAGPMAGIAKDRAARIAVTMHHHVGSLEETAEHVSGV